MDKTLNIDKSNNINYKWSLMIDNLIRYKFNITKAYMNTYDTTYDIAKANGSRLLANDNFKEQLDTRLSEIDMDLLITKDYILSKLKKEADTARNPSDRIRATELLGKYLALFTERTENTIDMSIQQNRSILDAVNDRLSRN